MAKNTNFLIKLDLLLLSTLVHQDRYGYEMTKIISEKTNYLFVPKHGTMYPILYNLLNNQYISSYNQVVDNKNRVYYHLEDSGKIYLEQLKKEYSDLIQAINCVIFEDEGDNHHEH